MSKHLDFVIQALKERFDGELGEFRGELRVILSTGHIVEVARALREEFGFEYLSDLTAVDYWPQMEPRFHAVYQFSSLEHNVRLEVRVPVSGYDEVLPSIEGIYFNANWYEREVYDMFGIQVEGHPDLRRILMPHDWEGHPLQKDYPLGYEEVQFSFNLDEIDLRKPYAEE
jgi:NADH-quinone oxidoreductase subunit C